MESVVRPNDDGSVMVAITGSINEYAQPQLKRILLQLTNPTKIEIGRIEVINSIGTMYWMKFLKSLLRVRDSSGTGSRLRRLYNFYNL